jgi:hypothetical protein
MGGLLLFVGYGRFRNLYQKVRIYFLASLLGMGGLGFILGIFYCIFFKNNLLKNN